MDTLKSEWKPKGKIYLLEIMSDAKNKTTFSAPTWVRDNNTLIMWVKERIKDNTIPIFDELVINRQGIESIVKL